MDRAPFAASRQPVPIHVHARAASPHGQFERAARVDGDRRFRYEELSAHDRNGRATAGQQQPHRHRRVAQSEVRRRMGPDLDRRHFRIPPIRAVHPVRVGPGPDPRRAHSRRPDREPIRRPRNLPAADREHDRGAEPGARGALRAGLVARRARMDIGSRIPVVRSIQSSAVGRQPDARRPRAERGLPVRARRPGFPAEFDPAVHAAAGVRVQSAEPVRPDGRPRQLRSVLRHHSTGVRERRHEGVPAAAVQSLGDPADILPDRVPAVPGGRDRPEPAAASPTPGALGRGGDPRARRGPSAGSLAGRHLAGFPQPSLREIHRGVRARADRANGGRHGVHASPHVATAWTARVQPAGVDRASGRSSQDSVL